MKARENEDFGDSEHQANVAPEGDSDVAIRPSFPPEGFYGGGLNGEIEIGLHIDRVLWTLVPPHGA